MAKNNLAQERIESEQQAIVRITNDDLICKDCLQRFDDSVVYGNTSRCEFYPSCKPIQVLRGEGCEQYVKE